MKYGALLVMCALKTGILGTIAADADELRRCDVNVSGTFSFSGICLTRSSYRGMIVYLLTHRSIEKELPEYYFYLPYAKDEPASWNGESFGSHAHSPIGNFEVTGQCYVGQKFKICSAPLWD